MAGPAIGTFFNFLSGLAGGNGGQKPMPTPPDLLRFRRGNLGYWDTLFDTQNPTSPWYQGPSNAPAGGGGGGGNGGGVGIGPGGSPWQIGGAGGANPGWYGGGGGVGAGGNPYQGGPTGGAPQPNMDPGARGSYRAGVTPDPKGQGLASYMRSQGYGPPQQAQGMSMSNAGGTPGYGMQPGGYFSTQLPGAPGTGMMGRAENIYGGQFGTPTTALQQQSLGGISQFLASDPYGQSNNALSQIMGSKAPDYFGGAQNAYNKVGNADYFGKAQGAFDQLQNGNFYGDASDVFKGMAGYNPFQPAQGALEAMFAQNPGQGVANSLQPLYNRALAQANQEGGRFGSSNAILNSRALDDYNISLQQAMAKGIDQQIAAAGQYGNMGNSLINARLGAGQGLLGVGNGRMQQQGDAARGLLGIGQGQLDQGLGVANGLTNIGQGRSSQYLGNQANQINAAGQYAQNQNNLFGNMQGAYNTGKTQADQEAERFKEYMQFIAWQQNAMQESSMQGQGAKR